MFRFRLFLSCFLFTTPATTEIYPLSLHDALPIWPSTRSLKWTTPVTSVRIENVYGSHSSRIWFCLNGIDRKSTRLNSSHLGISYAVFCLKKKKKQKVKNTREEEK